MARDGLEPDEICRRLEETIPKVDTSFDEIIETGEGCTGSSHCGPNTLGILYKRIKG
ncbi:MAG: hypothetical protein ACOX42_01925 [Clostridia bacterium]|jgi:hypothetical protein